MTKQIAANLEIAFPLGGYCERKDIQKYYKVSQNTWRKMRDKGRAPQIAHYYSSNKIFYKNDQAIEFLKDPDNYYALGFEPNLDVEVK